MSNDSDEVVPSVFRRTQQWILEYPGFFKPYQGWEDALFTLASPVIAPVVLAGTAGECLIFALLAEILAAPAAIISGIVACSPKQGQDTFDYMISHGRELFVASIVYLGFALLSIVGAPIGLVTRTISSIADGIANLCVSNNNAPELSPTI